MLLKRSSALTEGTAMSQIAPLDGEWRKATRSTGANTGCVELRFDPATGGVQLRDSKLGNDSPVLSFTAHELACFKDGVVNGEFELA